MTKATLEFFFFFGGEPAICTAFYFGFYIRTNRGFGFSWSAESTDKTGIDRLPVNCEKWSGAGVIDRFVVDLDTFFRIPVAQRVRSPRFDHPRPPY